MLVTASTIDTAKCRYGNDFVMAHVQGEVGRPTGLMAWGETSLRSVRRPRTSCLAWPTCLQPLVSPRHAPAQQQQVPQHQLPAPTHPSRLAPPSLWKSPPTPQRKHKLVRPDPGVASARVFVHRTRAGSDGVSEHSILSRT